MFNLATKLQKRFSIHDNESKSQLMCADDQSELRSELWALLFRWIDLKIAGQRELTDESNLNIECDMG